jgi:hypothetical protein
MTNGEPRYPRVGQIVWLGGSTPAGPRTPVIDTTVYWRWTSPDSLVTRFINGGGWAYHFVVTLENRDGVRGYSPPLGQLGGGRDWFLYAAARESLGVLMPPRIRQMRWEDYGGVEYSHVPLPTATSPTR